MLTLGEDQIRRQAEVSRFREQQNRNREALWDAIERKTTTVAPDGEIDVTNLERQIGSALHSDEFIRRLRLMNSNLIFEPTDWNPNRISIYVDRSVRNETGGWERHRMYLAAFDRGYLPERSVRHVKRTRMPDPDNSGEWMDVDEFQRETRGWRTVLARLLRERLISMPQIERTFPPNLASRNWQRLTA